MQSVTKREWLALLILDTIDFRPKKKKKSLEVKKDRYFMIANLAR